MVAGAFERCRCRRIRGNAKINETFVAAMGEKRPHETIQAVQARCGHRVVEAETRLKTPHRRHRQDVLPRCAIPVRPSERRLQKAIPLGRNLTLVFVFGGGGEQKLELGFAQG